MRNITSFLQVLLFSFLLLSSPNANAAEQEHALKAGFLYNFARYGNWQDNTTNDEYFNLCSADAAFVDTAQSTLKQRSVDDKPILIKQIQFEGEQFNHCQLLFITSETFIQWVNWHNVHPKALANTMIVGESKGTIEAGGHIRFFIASGKVRFEISPQQLQQSGITMSSKVLRLGRVLDR
ncbi:YfiR family protein [Shewanella electrodiphila]|uniref:YfiR family protein n=1 Tax=Shewanella electrodiphila TaxID=934143 RepID=A0ABT0KIQ5_9GAMM|nr:YfiR family protein [Shewanella electrodiphila]MCL1043723.1 YfiR family protein [Shewanella electrodiphila]